MSGVTWYGLKLQSTLEYIQGFPILGVPFGGIPIIRTIVYIGSILGSPYFGKLPSEFAGLALKRYAITGIRAQKAKIA